VHLRDRQGYSKNGGKYLKVQNFHYLPPSILNIMFLAFGLLAVANGEIC
jgi:hypothetical protein